MRTVAVSNQKGGSGKTTTAVNMAAALAETGARVLVLDLDAQASASAWFGQVDDSMGLLDVLTGSARLVDLVRPTSVPGVSLIPASAWLIQADQTLAGEVGRETLLRAAVDTLPAADYDFLLVDCPPTLGLLSLSALVACREVLVPVEARVMALAGLVSLWQTVERVRLRLNPRLHVSAVLACRVDARTNLSRDVVAQLRERFGPLVLEPVIRENVRLAEAPSHAQPITVYAPDSAGAADYRAAARAFLAVPSVRRARA
jgi:chromosome partitioning protein